MVLNLILFIIGHPPVLPEEISTTYLCISALIPKKGVTLILPEDNPAITSHSSVSIS